MWLFSPQAKPQPEIKKFSQLSTHPQTSIGGGSQHAQPSGTGLGLNLCYKFVQRMNGNIWLCNNSEQGATFSFYLSVTRGSKEPQTESMRQDPPSPTTILDSNVAHRFRVLVADENYMINKPYCFGHIRSRQGLIYEPDFLNNCRVRNWCFSLNPIAFCSPTSLHKLHFLQLLQNWV